MAAKQAGLEREVVEAYYIGDKRYDEVHKFYEIIGCHDARRTFVCCSLALGIPATTVMKWTGHKDYESMKPYIEINDDTLKTEMEKWNGKSLKHEIIRAIDKFNENKLKKVCEFVNSLSAEIA